jgi:type II secretory pathway component PulF
MRFKIQAMDKGGKEQTVTIEAQSSQDAFQKAREQGLFPTKVVETVDEAGIVTKGLPPTEPGKRITVSLLRQVLAVAAAAGAWVISSLVCSALTGGPTGFSETTAKFLPFVFAFFTYGAVAMAGRKDV